jgi:hypothetical protein
MGTNQATGCAASVVLSGQFRGTGVVLNSGAVWSQEEAPPPLIEAFHCLRMPEWLCEVALGGLPKIGTGAGTELKGMFPPKIQWRCVPVILFSARTVAQHSHPQALLAQARTARDSDRLTPDSTTNKTALTILLVYPLGFDSHEFASAGSGSGCCMYRP